MNQLKSVYISAFITAALAGLIVAVNGWIQAGGASPWLGTAVACATPILFFTRVYAFPIARTSPNMHIMLIGGVLGTVIALGLGAAPLATPVLLAAGVGIVGVILYIYWYSRFAAPGRAPLQTGAMLPDFDLREGGQTRRASGLTGKPALWIFYRGNWCPLCMAQIREVADQYRELSRRGVEVFLISPQPEGNTASLATRFDVPMRFMTDTGNVAARTLGIDERNGLPGGLQVFGYGSDVPRPTVFITAAGGRLIYCDLSENYRVRPEPVEFLAVFDRHAASAIVAA